MFYQQWAPYVPVAERRRQAAAKMAALKRKGYAISPVVITGRAIATTVWGKAWCANLEAYSDYANRLPRGRTYVRNGSVVDLQIAPGGIKARVSGSSIYRITVTVKPVARTRWEALCTDCAGGIDSLVELLQGRFATGVMERLCQPGDGILPTPKEIQLDCSCPDGAYLCKHVAAVLYGFGARLDHQPELLFTLRQVAATDLLAKAGAGLTAEARGSAPDRTLAMDDVGALFGLELDQGAPPESARSGKTQKRNPAASDKRNVARATTAAARAPRPRAVDLFTQLHKLLRKHGALSSATAQAELGQTSATLRPLLQRLVSERHATVSGKTRGTTYHAMG